jgi:hypothetical protein
MAGYADLDALQGFAFTDAQIELGTEGTLGPTDRRMSYI